MIKPGAFTIKRWGRAIRIEQSSDVPAVIKKLVDSVTGKKTQKAAMSRKHLIVPSTIEFVLKQPGPLADPLDFATVAAAKVMSVRFTKLKKFKRDHPYLFEPWDGKSGLEVFAGVLAK